MIKKICQECGQTYMIKKSKENISKYCSNKCRGSAQRKRIEKKCQVCGKIFETYVCYLKRGHAKYCSNECKKIGQVGENAANWQGGKSFEPYCILFNEEFKERVRKFWGRKCGISGLTEKENNKKLAVHHVNYDKQSCCNTTVPLFIPLSNEWHGRTNHNRDYWEENLTNYIMIWFDGECYEVK